MSTTAQRPRESTTSTSRYELLDRSFQVLTTDSTLDENRATVHRTSGTVRITGVVRAPKNCYAAGLAGYDLTPDAGFFEASIETYRPSDAETCEDTAVGIEYEATFEFDDRTPEHVRVIHDGEPATENEVD